MAPIHCANGSMLVVPLVASGPPTGQVGKSGSLGIVGVPLGETSKARTEVVVLVVGFGQLGDGGLLQSPTSHMTS